MTSKLTVRRTNEFGFSEAGLFEASEAIFEPVLNEDGTPSLTEDGQPVSQMHIPAYSATDNAVREGKRLCEEEDVEAFQVWELVASKQRTWKLEDM